MACAVLVLCCGGLGDRQQLASHQPLDRRDEGVTVKGLRKDSQCNAPRLFGSASPLVQPGVGREGRQP